MSNKRKRLDRDTRRDEILAAALQLARVHGYNRITRDQIAAHAGVSMGLVTLYLGTIPNLRRDLMRAAVSKGIPEIIAQGLAAGDPHAVKASPELKRRATDHLLAQ
jgi:AcrR family transcriptional regulator